MLTLKLSIHLEKLNNIIYLMKLKFLIRIYTIKNVWELEKFIRKKSR